MYIAKRLGFPKSMLEREYEEAYKNQDSIKRTAIDDDFLNGDFEEMSVENVSSQRIIRQISKAASVPNPAEQFSLGDSVIVLPEKKLGIICQTANAKGELGVMMQKKKSLINHKRLQLKMPATELYPPDYDFSVIFDTVANRKARHQLDKGHRPGVVVQVEDELK
ncbi:hypothetical protein SDC9_181895 [bioreactor metagenome]|uniref:Uncharacterized protein n=1 Tax=bioreactor metagenome TaxID=1076179 RepID=A0A645H7R0_9ZZZZ